MLVLSRKIDERIIIGDNIVIQVLAITPDQVRIGIEAPRSVRILREEIYQSVKQENEVASAASAAVSLESIANLAQTLRQS